MKIDPIPLFYWSERKFTFKDNENYGDLLSKYIVEKVSGKPVKFVHPKKQAWYKWNKNNFLAIGSIIHHATKESIVWGSGIIDHEQMVHEADFRAVRGPRTKGYLQKQGYKCPEVYGDPALLLPKYYKPKVEKEYLLGIIPHYHDYQEIVELYKHEKDIKVVDLMTMDIEKVTREILQCEKIVSSSLHGLIVAHAYQIPAIWIEFSQKLFGDGIKFKDYLESVEIPFYQGKFIKEKYSLKSLQELVNNHKNLPRSSKVRELQQGLIDSCPF